MAEQRRARVLGAMLKDGAELYGWGVETSLDVERAHHKSRKVAMELCQYGLLVTYEGKGATDPAPKAMLALIPFSNVRSMRMDPEWKP